MQIIIYFTIQMHNAFTHTFCLSQISDNCQAQSEDLLLYYSSFGTWKVWLAAGKAGRMKWV